MSTHSNTLETDLNFNRVMQTDPSSDSAGATEHRDVPGGHGRRSGRRSHWSERGESGLEAEALGPGEEGASLADALRADVRPETRLRC